MPVEKTFEEATKQAVDSSIAVDSAITFEQERFEQETSGQDIIAQKQSEPEYKETDKQDKLVSDIEQPLLCPVCGEQVEEGAAFCGNCGNRI